MHRPGGTAMSQRHLILLVILVLTLVSFSRPGGHILAQTPTTRFVATTGSDAGNCTNTSGNPVCKTIGYAVGQSASGDTIQVAAGLYCEHVMIGTNLTITGAGAGSTIVDGEGAGTSCTGALTTGTVFTIPAATPPLTVGISGPTVQHGSTPPGGSGGGIYDLRGTLNVTNATLSDNSASVAGGGIYYGSGASGALTNVTLSGNSVSCSTPGCSALGGGIYGDSLTLTNVTLSGNSANGGGAIWGGSLTLTNVTLS